MSEGSPQSVVQSPQSNPQFPNSRLEPNTAPHRSAPHRIARHRIFADISDEAADAAQRGKFVFRKRRLSKLEKSNNKGKVGTAAGRSWEGNDAVRTTKKIIIKRVANKTKERRRGVRAFERRPPDGCGVEVRVYDKTEPRSSLSNGGGGGGGGGGGASGGGGGGERESGFDSK
ncbi:hypothetical protein V9T40_002951 [Parthenolecanium corni]|uniref:Uncharacterized protein n=1 Tax=Parthenolecanium corni TaxID=536013 RepID=A0AAN9TLP1_9HEMI